MSFKELFKKKSGNNGISFVIDITGYEKYPFLRNNIENLMFQTQDCQIIVVYDPSVKQAELLRPRFQEEKCCFIAKNSDCRKTLQSILKAVSKDYICFWNPKYSLAYQAAEAVAERAKTAPFDVLYLLSLHSVAEDEEGTDCWLKSGAEIREFLSDMKTSLSCFVFQKDFIIKNQNLFFMDVPEQFITVGLCCGAEKICLPSRGFLHYIYGDSVESQKQPYSFAKAKAFMEELLRHCRQEYVEEIYVVFSKIFSATAEECDDFYACISYLGAMKKNVSAIESDTSEETRRNIQKNIKRLVRYTDVKINKVIYVNYFDSSVPKNVIEENLSQFAPDFKIEYLEPSDKKLAQNPDIRRAIENGRYREAGIFAGLLSCSSNGGIYLDPQIILTNDIKPLLYYLAFFGFESENTFSLNIFGAKKGSPVLKQIMNEIKRQDCSLNGINFAVSKILCCLYGIHMTPYTLQNRKRVTVFPVTAFVFGDSTGKSFCVYRTENMRDNEVVQCYQYAYDIYSDMPAQRNRFLNQLNTREQTANELRAECIEQFRRMIKEQKRMNQE